MITTLIELLPLIIASAILPSWITATIFLLQSQHGLKKAIALAGGMAIARLAQIILFGSIYSSINIKKVLVISPILITALEIVIGIFFLISAIRVLFYMSDLDELPLTWEAHLNRVGPWLTFGIGVLWLLVSGKLWMFTLSAIGIINSADLGTLQRLLAYTFYLVGSQILIGLPIVVCIILPGRSASILKAWSDLLTKYYRPIIISISSIFSFYFLWHGLYKLFT
ncbi:GAP family protein [Dictyobacter formicarum]|nr:GAP family protein [Dictyobacter formicarum]